MEERNYSKDLAIDINALHLEWLRQPQLFMEYAEQCADARRKLDKVKESIDVLKAEKDSIIRQNWAANGVKCTEAQVSNHVLMDPDYRKATDHYIELKYEYEMLSSAVKAFEQKKSALENLVRLHGQQYFSSPEVNDGDWNEQTREGVKERIKTRMNKEDDRNG